jgi:hypothetical protein
MTNNKGITAIIVLISLLVIAVIGGVGYYIWDSHNKSDTTLQSSVQTTAPNESAETDVTFVAVKDFETASDRLRQFAEQQTASTKCLSMQFISEYEDFAVINQGVADSDINGNTPADGTCGGYGGGAQHYYKFTGETYTLLFATQDSLVCGSKEIEQLPVALEPSCVTVDGTIQQR